jgi:hypothetical protein
LSSQMVLTHMKPTFPRQIKSTFAKGRVWLPLTCKAPCNPETCDKSQCKRSRRIAGHILCDGKSGSWTRRKKQLLTTLYVVGEEPKIWFNCLIRFRKSKQIRRFHESARNNCEGLSLRVRTRRVGGRLRVRTSNKAK